MRIPPADRASRLTAGRALVVFGAVAAVGIALVIPKQETIKTVSVPLVFSSDAKELLEPLVESFNKAEVTSDGAGVKIVPEAIASGQAESAISHRDAQPIAWIPASSLWIQVLNHDVEADWAPAGGRSVVQSPQVIAMWKPQAEALGWPAAELGFGQIIDLARSGQFKLGHTHPDISTSGLSAVLWEYFEAAGKTSGLAVADIRDRDVRARVRSLERSIVHYGETAGDFSDQMCHFGPGYASAVYMQETTLLEYPAKKCGSPPLVGIYPADGTFVADYPYLVLRAPWVSDRERDAAAVFGRWLARHVTNELAARNRFRLAGKRPLAPIDRKHGADPEQPRTVLRLPEQDVLAEIKRSWHGDRKPATIMLAVDTSGTMGEEGRLPKVQQALRTFIANVSPRDRLGLITFSDDSRTEVPLGPLDDFRRRQLDAAIGGIFTEGETALYDAVTASYDAVAKTADPERINAVVVLTDGSDNRSSVRLEGLLRKLSARSITEGTVIRVFTVAFSDQADRTVLRKIADASGGVLFEGGTGDIKDVYTSISYLF